MVEIDEIYGLVTTSETEIEMDEQWDPVND